MEKKVTIKNEKGFHIRPVGVFVKKAASFKSNIEVQLGNKKVNGKSVMILMSLGAKKGDELTISAEGPDEKEAVEALSELVESGFGEN